ncbi:MAG: rod shape-determining protein MreC [Bacteroidota bacterium]|jgi:rod shape-determining protein MreC|nr:rod shape-determining protein MreC [Sphingobacteriales bacterium]
MRNLIFFISKYYVFFMFFGLEIFSFIIIYRFNHYQKASFVNYTTGATSSFYSAVSNTQQYFSLRRMNDSLQIENAKLRSQLFSSYYQNGLTVKNINDSLYKQQYEYIAAMVVNNSVTKRNNYITLNRGSLHGIEPQMGVISESGIVGIVLSVSPRYCTVLSLLNNNCKISAKVKKNGAFGSLVWDGADPRIARLLDVNKHVPVATNDLIITSNYSTIFPEGIPIGKIYSHTLDAGDNFHTIKVELFTDFSMVSTVYVIRNLLKQEQQTLESTLKN